MKHLSPFLLFYVCSTQLIYLTDLLLFILKLLSAAPLVTHSQQVALHILDLQMFVPDALPEAVLHGFVAFSGIKPIGECVKH